MITEKLKSIRNKKPIIILMSRWHAVNRCKSRLSKEIGSIKAANVQKQLTQHTIAVAKEVQAKGLADIRLAIDGIGINAAKRWAKLNEIDQFSAQGSGNLGTKMRRQFSKAQSHKTQSNKIANRILLIGTDLPTISQCDLIEALEILLYKEMVLGPSIDGGYWLIGLSNQLLNPLCIWPFCGINWGTKEVLKETTRLAKFNKINYQLLQEKNDLDNLVDFYPWIDSEKFQLSASLYQL